MKLNKLFACLFVFPVFSLQASIFGDSEPRKSKEEFEYRKCVEGDYVTGVISAKLTLDEVCKYGKKGCSTIKTNEKIQAYCENKTLSECFENKSWLTIDQILEVPLSSNPGLITYGLKKGAPTEGKICGYWD